jgi:NTP pyrophosphatase (non-canonical NTP hydrolase)
LLNFTTPLNIRLYKPLRYQQKNDANSAYRFLAEELKELQQAVDDNNLVEVADALCDLQYVLAGAILEFGLAEKFKELFDEVHRSNMSKACKTEEEANLTINHYKNTANTESYHKAADGLFLVYRTADNKTLKSVNYSPANLAGILGNGE